MKMRLRTYAVIALALAAAVALPGTARAASRSHKRRLIVTFQEGMTRSEREQAARDMGLKLTGDFPTLGISVLEAAGDVQPQEVTRARKHAKALAVEDDEYRKWIFDGVPGFGEVEAAVHAQAAAAQALGRRRPSPADPGAGDGPSADANTPWGVARVNAPAAWGAGRGAGVKVAVIDTGIDCTHPDLQCDFSAGTNIVDPSATPMDDNEHGTHVAGTIAGRGTGGPLGVAPKATLIPVKVLDGSGSGSLSDIVAGINWAADAGVDVINMSLGGPNTSSALQRAVQKALSAGVVIVCAAGNSGPGANTVGYPAGYPGVIAIAASDRNDKVASFSSRGDAVAFIAPGVKITSTIPGGGLKDLSGTSMASPHAAGLAALAIERGAKGPAGVRRAFASAATALPGLDATAQGAGMIDAAQLGR